MVTLVKPFENQIIRLQAYFRAAVARNRWQTMRKNRIELVASISGNKNALVGICRLQAVVRGRAVRDAQRKRRRRNEIAKEIATTEEKYVQALQTAVDVYLKRLRACEEIPPTTIRTIFSEIEVIRSYNTVINAKLQAVRNLSRHNIIHIIAVRFIAPHYSSSLLSSLSLIISSFLFATQFKKWPFLPLFFFLSLSAVFHFLTTLPSLLFREWPSGFPRAKS